MRAERLTQRTAEAAWNAARQVYNGPLQLPCLDMGKIFNGRKSITWREALAGIKEAIESSNG